MRKYVGVMFAVWAVAFPSRGLAVGKRVIVTFKSGTPELSREQALRTLNARLVDTIMSNGRTSEEFVAVVAEIEETASSWPSQEAGQEIFTVLALQSSGVLKVEEDRVFKWIEALPAFDLPSASLSSMGLSKFKASLSAVVAGGRSEIPWGVVRVRAPAVWDSTEGAGARVAVIDSGIDASHKDLQSKVDGGYNAISDSEKPDSYLDDNGHGTHVAGTIGAARSARGNFGVVGVAPKARLYAVKVLDAGGNASLSHVIKGVIWCVNNGMHVANMSLGAPINSESLHRAIRHAKARGVVVVAAAGNTGAAVVYPGAYPEVISVSASDWNDQLAAFSSRGPEIDFIAPGAAIVSTRMGGDYISLSGTSMAAPHVSGLAALAVSLGYRGLDGPDGVLERLKRAAKPLSGLAATDQGFGIVDGGRLVR